ncbi:hypothetical protein O7606_22445 [Micromonospora sp. WMMD882]|uniref:hypothetical protein n=1 Tax=Micromonospora sp. WMMD882 TaxID=3015151 RepID=UPI00248AEA30|nr:hypothetical protein [Micromonospora sp. WMMD882]WBB78926.1 hypothetical protein O7606_22445 [Micromonospora sp. WMMD882]
MQSRHQRLRAEPTPRLDEAGRPEPDASAGHPGTAAERACVVTALRLGWWMADAYHHAQLTGLGDGGGPRPTVPPAKLSNLTEMSGRQRMQMYLDGVDVALAQIAALSRNDGVGPSTAAAQAKVGRARHDRPGDVAAMLFALNELNVDVLRWAMATNHRVGLAYRLGRSLADTVRRCDAEQLAHRFGGRQTELRRWLEELASVLPPYAAPVVRRSLESWTTAVRATLAGDPAEAEPRDLAHELRNQGDLWRGVLTGGLHPRDLLDEEHYAIVARNLIIRDRKLVVRAARGIFYPVLVPLVLVLVAVVGVSAAAAGGSPVTRAAIALLGLGAGLAAIWRSVSGPALQVASEVNRPLLHSELVAQMADCVSRPLDAARAATAARRGRAT